MTTRELRARLAKCIEITVELRKARRMTPEQRLREHGDYGEARLMSDLQYELEALDEEV